MTQSKKLRSPSKDTVSAASFSSPENEDAIDAFLYHGILLLRNSHGLRLFIQKYVEFSTSTSFSEDVSPHENGVAV